MMHMQVDECELYGICARQLNSSVTEKEREETYDLLGRGGIRLLFTTPETCETSRFMGEMLKRKPLAFAIDEAHCISQWGNDFRPAYKQLGILREKAPDVPLLALTATAKKNVRQDIVQSLGMKDHVCIGNSVRRANLFYEVRMKLDDKKMHMEIAKEILQSPKEPTIVYCFTRADTEKLCETLRSRSIQCEYFHAGISVQEKVRVQEDFKNEIVNVIVATTAFGMGEYMNPIHLFFETHSYTCLFAVCFA